MSEQTQASRILQGLERVANERQLRKASALLSRRVESVKYYQQARLRLTMQISWRAPGTALLQSSFFMICMDRLILRIEMRSLRGLFRAWCECCRRL